ncbi:hypothetical protein NUSPORA_02708 [Nucleospora cyclopteri]
MACSLIALNRFLPFNFVLHNLLTLANSSTLIFSAVSPVSSLLLFSIILRYLYPWVQSIKVASFSHTGAFVADLSLLISSPTTSKNLLVSSNNPLRSLSSEARSFRSSIKSRRLQAYVSSSECAATFGYLPLSFRLSGSIHNTNNTGDKCFPCKILLATLFLRIDFLFTLMSIFHFETIDSINRVFHFGDFYL